MRNAVWRRGLFVYEPGRGSSVGCSYQIVLPSIGSDDRIGSAYALHWIAYLTRNPEVLVLTFAVRFDRLLEEALGECKDPLSDIG